MTENALALIEGKTELVFTTPEGLNPLINAVKEQVKGVIHDISTKKGRDACISLSVQVRDTKTELERRKLSLTEEMRSKISLINAEGKRAWDELEKVQKEVRQPVTEWENKEKERIAGHEAKLIEVEAFRTFSGEPTSEQVRKRLIKIEGFTHDWQEFEARGNEAVQRVFTALEQKLEVVKKREDDAAELERLREDKAKRDKEEYEQKIANDAAEKARKETEAKAAADAKREADRIQAIRDEEVRVQAEKDKAAEDERIRLENETKRLEKEKEDARLKAVEAEASRLKAIEDAAIAAKKAEEDRIVDAKKAEDARIAAEAKAEQDKLDAVDKERKRVEAENQRIADDKAKREADKAHRDKINSEAFESILAVMAGDNLLSAREASQALILAISNDQITHITINY